MSRQWLLQYGAVVATAAAAATVIGIVLARKRQGGRRRRRPVFYTPLLPLTIATIDHRSILASPGGALIAKSGKYPITQVFDPRRGCFFAAYGRNLCTIDAVTYDHTRKRFAHHRLAEVAKNTSIAVLFLHGDLLLYVDDPGDGGPLVARVLHLSPVRMSPSAVFRYDQPRRHHKSVMVPHVVKDEFVEGLSDDSSTSLEGTCWWNGLFIIPQTGLTTQIIDLLSHAENRVHVISHPSLGETVHSSLFYFVHPSEARSRLMIIAQTQIFLVATRQQLLAPAEWERVATLMPYSLWSNHSGSVLHSLGFDIDDEHDDPSNVAERLHASPCDPANPCDTVGLWHVAGGSGSERRSRFHLNASCAPDESPVVAWNREPLFGHAHAVVADYAGLPDALAGMVVDYLGWLY